MIRRLLISVALSLGSIAARADNVFSITNDTSLMTCTDRILPVDSAYQFRLSVHAFQGTTPVSLSNRYVRFRLYDLRDGGTVVDERGEITDAGAGRFSVALDLSALQPGNYEAHGESWRTTNDTLAANLSCDRVQLYKTALNVGLTNNPLSTSGGGGGGGATGVTVNVNATSAPPSVSVIVTGITLTGSSSGGVTVQGISTGNVTLAMSDGSVITNAGNTLYVPAPPLTAGVTVWSNGVVMGTYNAIQITTGLNVRSITSGTNLVAQLYPSFASGQGTSIPGTTQLAAFAYTGSTQTYIVASGMTQMLAKIWGAAPQQAGVNGGYTEVVFPVTPLETLYLVVGMGTSRTNPGPGIRPFGGAGYMVQTNVGGTVAFPGASGSFIFRNAGATQDLIACAGGGAYGCSGGGLSVQVASGSSAGQTNGGVATIKTTNTDGSYLLGGLSATNGGCGGGSGFYGGLGSHTNNVAGGGGSGTIQFGQGITVRSNYSFDDDYPGTPAGYPAAVGAGGTQQGGHGYIILKGFVSP